MHSSSAQRRWPVRTRTSRRRRRPTIASSVPHPAALVLRFSESARLTALWLTQDDGPKRKLEVPAASQPQITVALPPLTPGHYLISWRALSADGHVVPGQIRFTLAQ